MNTSLRCLRQPIGLAVFAACFCLACFGARAVEPHEVLHGAMEEQLESLEIAHLADFRQWAVRHLNNESTESDALDDLHQQLVVALEETSKLERTALKRAVTLHELILVGLDQSAKARASSSAADDAAQTINQIQSDLARVRHMVSDELKRIEDRDEALARESARLEVQAKRLGSGESSEQVALRTRSTAYNTALAAHEARVRRSATAYNADVDAYKQWLNRSQARLTDQQKQMDAALDEYRTFVGETDERRAQLNTEIEAYNALVSSQASAEESEVIAKAEEISAGREAIRKAIGLAEKMAVDVSRLQESGQSLAQRLQAESQARSSGLRASRQAELDEEQLDAERLLNERRQIELQALELRVKLERAASMLSEDVKRHQEILRLASNSDDREFHGLASKWLAGGDVEPLRAWLADHRQDDRTLDRELVETVESLKQLPLLREAIVEANKNVVQARAYAQKHTVALSKARAQLAADWQSHAQARAGLIETEHLYEGLWRRWLTAQSTTEDNALANVLATLAELVEADLAVLRAQLGFSGPFPVDIDAKRAEFSHLAMDYGIEIANWGREGVIALFTDISITKGGRDTATVRRLRDWLERAETQPWLVAHSEGEQSRELLAKLLEITLANRAVLREKASGNGIEAFLGAGQVVLTMDGSVQSAN